MPRLLLPDYHLLDDGDENVCSLHAGTNVDGGCHGNSCTVKNEALIPTATGLPGTPSQKLGRRWSGCSCLTLIDVPERNDDGWWRAVRPKARKRGLRKTG